jgi:hypothetical protein
MANAGAECRPCIQIFMMLSTRILSLSPGRQTWTRWMIAADGWSTPRCAPQPPASAASASPAHTQQGSTCWRSCARLTASLYAQQGQSDDVKRPTRVVQVYVCVFTNYRSCKHAKSSAPSLQLLRPGHWWARPETAGWVNPQAHIPNSAASSLHLRASTNQNLTSHAIFQHAMLLTTELEVVRCS